MNMHAVPEARITTGQEAAPAQAWRIAFPVDAGLHAAPLAVIREPMNAVAVASPVDLNEALAASAAPQDGSLLVIWIRSAPGSALDLDARLQAWIKAGLAPNQSAVHASIKSVRIECTSIRCIVHAAPEQLADAMDAVARFVPVLRATTELEARMTATWPRIKAHTPLTHAVTRAQLRLQREVDGETERATEMKAMHLRLATALEQLDQTLSATSKRIYADLAAAAALPDRVEMLEDPIQFALDHYELANWRLTEIGAARTGKALEVLIILILLADFCMRVLEYLLPYVSSWFSPIIPG
ncbi:MAG TPA: hypothetical protein VKW08_27155 [Xanthobacteraceae bacterium]|nr:hypothetical protein [Xanthobacteraceae bacterium]